MPGRLAHICILIAASLWASQQPSYAQQTALCPTSHTEDDEPTGPEISIADVTFSGSLQMPISDQNEIAATIKEKTQGTSLDFVTDEALERARGGWQDRGYFKAQVTGDAKTITSSPANQRIGLNVHVDEGVRYNLKRITFNGNKAINVKILRGLFPINAGDIFSREKIAEGLDNLREAYGDLGYINFTSVPNTQFDDENKLISVKVDLDEGKQFRIGSVNVLGLDESARDELLKALPIKSGEIFSSQFWKEALLKHASMFPDCDCSNHEARRLDEKLGVVTLTLDFRPCSTN